MDDFYTEFLPILLLFVFIFGGGVYGLYQNRMLNRKQMKKLGDGELLSNEPESSNKVLEWSILEVYGGLVESSNDVGFVQKILLDVGIDSSIESYFMEDLTVVYKICVSEKDIGKAIQALDKFGYVKNN